MENSRSDKNRWMDKWSWEEIELIKKMSVKEAAEKLGRSYESVKGARKRYGVRKFTRKQKQDHYKRGTLCWDCAHAYGTLENQCSWARSFTPVDGWDAAPCTVPGSNGKYAYDMQSYFVRKCPEFEMG